MIYERVDIDSAHEVRVCIFSSYRLWLFSSWFEIQAGAIEIVLRAFASWTGETKQ